MLARREMLASTAAVAAATWVTPSVVGLARAAAATPSNMTCELPMASGGAVLLEPPPASILEGVLESDTETYVFRETETAVMLTAPLVVNRVSPGNFNGQGPFEQVEIPTGTLICSYYVHGDRVNNKTTHYGEITFSSSVIAGLIYENPEFNASAFLEVPTTTYVNGGMSQFDFMTLSSTSLSWSMTGSQTDSIRVITVCA